MDDFCVDPYCVLCTLKMKDGDDIVFVSLKEEPYFQQSRYYSCVISNCKHSRGLARASHSICADEGLPSLRTCEVTRRDSGFELSIAQSADLERQRNQMLDMARSTLQVQKKMTEVSKGEIRTSSCVWATFVTLHGETYVSNLSNSCGDHLIYNPEFKSTADVIYVARGALGVKKVVFACSAETLEIENYPWDWWQALPLTEGCVLHFEFDGLKLRNLLRPQHGDLQLPLWSAPTFRQDLIRFPLLQSLKPARFNRVIINDPETIGYSVAWNPARRALKIVRQSSMDDLACYVDMPDDTTTWLHVPVSHGELLKEIWRRDCLENRRQVVDLILLTTTGRVHVLGKHPTPGQRYTYSRVATLRSQSDYLYIDDSAGIRELALNPAPEVPGTPLDWRLPSPMSRYPALTPVESYFYSSASLENLDFIQQSNFYGVIKGVLLHYHNGQRASLGQVRLDRLGDKQHIPRGATIRFVVSQTSEQCPYVSSVLVHTPDTAERLSPAKLDVDLEVTCRGTLEWWFTRRQCQLAHEGRSSAFTRI